MTAWIIITAALLVLLGPLRRTAFGRHVRFTLPAIAGAILGAAFGRWTQAHGVWIPCFPLICAVVGALIMGGEGKKIMDEWFGEKK